jgi:hypothetical protein
MWRIFADHLCRSRPGTEFYAEKAQVWVSHMVRGLFPCCSIYLFRDPRDVYISANAFMKKKNYYSFMRGPEDSDLAHARGVCASFVSYVTNYIADRGLYNCPLLRYEDLIGNTKEALGALEAATGLVLDGSAGAEQFGSHGTAASLALTGERWRREGLAEGVGELFERCAGAELARLGYLCRPPEERQAIPAVDFGAGGVDLGTLATSPDGGLERGADGHAVIRLTGPDFWIVLPLEPFPAAEVNEIWLCVKGGAGETCSVYWAGPSESLGADSAIHRYYQPSEHWQIIRFYVGTHPAWRGTIATVRVDVFNSIPDRISGQGEIQWVRLVP